MRANAAAVPDGNAAFFSFGTNDLTQMTFGFSRDDAGKFLVFIARLAAIQAAINDGKERDSKNLSVKTSIVAVSMPRLWAGLHPQTVQCTPGCLIAS